MIIFIVSTEVTIRVYKFFIHADVNILRYVPSYYKILYPKLRSSITIAELDTRKKP